MGIGATSRPDRRFQSFCHRRNFHQAEEASKADLSCINLLQVRRFCLPRFSEIEAHFGVLPSSEMFHGTAFG
jgi:hypothetical protein